MCLYDFDFQSIVSPRKCVYLNLEGGRETYHKDTKNLFFFGSWVKSNLLTMINHRILD